MEKKILKLNVTRCYLIKTPNAYILIDTGYEREWGDFCAKMKRASVDLSEISHLILTHHHDDHCGLLNHIVQENPHIQIVMSVLAKDLLLSGQNDRSHGGGLINRQVARLFWLERKLSGGSGIIKRMLKFPPYQVHQKDILVNRQTKLKEIGIDLDGSIIATPGHSIDSISVIFDDGDCFVGDAAANFLQFAGTKYCVIAVCDLDQYYQSWREIISENAQNIFPAHGKPFSADKLKCNLGKNKKEGLVLY